MRPVYAGIRRAVLGGMLVALAAGSADAAPVARQVLILQSSERGTLVFDLFTADFRAALEELFPEPVTVTQFAITPSGFAEAPERPVVDYLLSAFLNQSKPDLVVTVGGPAATFARKYRQELFSQVPVLFGLTDVRFLKDAPLADNETAVATAANFTRLVDDILQILPATTTVFMVTGAGPLARLWRGELEHDFERFRGRVTFIWSDDLGYEETLDRVASLPPHSAILYITSGSDAERGWHSTERVLADLSAKGNAPLFGVHSRWLGLGTVGGTLMFTEGLGRTAAGAAARILKGESPARVRIPPVEQGPAAFDARQLRRWNISEARLPSGSAVRFRGPSLWRDYRSEVLIALGVLAIQSILIVGLLYQRWARRRAEVESRRNLTLAADANRQATMSALTGSIAHELSQPLNSILHNAQAAEKLVASNRASPEMLREILSDIRTADGRATQIIDRHRAMLRNRQLDKKPLDIHDVVRESLALIDQDMRARRVQLDMDLPPDPCMIAGDSVLLQQVLVNLLINAMDAMAETPPGHRRLWVGTEVRPDSVAVSVRDAGTGLPASIDGRLFEPFVTTKTDGIGIGLTIAHSIVEAHRGRMEAHNNAGGGATFTFMLPCGESAFV